jgi:hypothetical protein
MVTTPVFIKYYIAVIILNCSCKLHVNKNWFPGVMVAVMKIMYYLPKCFCRLVKQREHCPNVYLENL